MHGEIDLPLLLPVYRVHSFELLTAEIAHLTGLAPIWVYYLVLPTLLAMLMIIAHWLVLRRLLPKAAFMALLVVLLVMLAWGDRHRSYANFGFVRLFQGKSVLLSVMVPLAFYYALRYIEGRDLRSLLLMCLVPIAGIGCSSSGLLSITAIVCLVLLAGWRPNLPQTKLVAAGLLAAVYPALVGLWMMGDVAASGGLSIRSMATDAASSTTRVFGDGGRAFLGFFAILAFSFMVTPGRRKLLLGFAFLTVAFVFSPWTSKLAAATVSANMSWRIYWAVPVPLLVGLAFAGLGVELTAGWRSGTLRGVACLLPGILFCAMPGTWAMSPDNGTRIGSPGYKVPEQYAIAEEAIRLTPPRGRVLASADVSPWIPVHRDHPYPIAVRASFVRNLADGMGRQEADLRLWMLGFVSVDDPPERIRELVVQEIESRRIDTIVFATRRVWRADLAADLERLGFTGHTFGAYEIWTANRTDP
jgi:hypothetical protein